MNRLFKLVISVVLVFFVGVAATSCWFNRERTKSPSDIVSISRFDSIFSKDIKLATSLADIPDLREVSLGVDDIEVRIWRSYSLPTQEGVFIKRVDGEWSGLHLTLKTDEHGAIQAAEVKQLKTPESGWQIFFGQLSEKGLRMLPLTAENECDMNILDGISLVVEISENNTYRNYRYIEGHDKCRESKQMTEIAEIIGMEFDSGHEECKRYEWFACVKTRK